MRNSKSDFNNNKEIPQGSRHVTGFPINTIMILTAVFNLLNVLLISFEYIIALDEKERYQLM